MDYGRRDDDIPGNHHPNLTVFSPDCYHHIVWHKSIPKDRARPLERTTTIVSLNSGAFRCVILWVSALDGGFDIFHSSFEDKNEELSEPGSGSNRVVEAPTDEAKSDSTTS